jgi:hypothetical protein
MTHPREVVAPRWQVAAVFASIVLCFSVIAGRGRVGALSSPAVLQVPADYATIQAALAAASAGDTILVAPGVYAGNVAFSGKNVTLQSTDGPAVTTIQGVGGTAVTIGPFGTIRGFTITGGNASFGAGMAVSGPGSVIAGNIFDGNIQGSGGYGAAIGGNSASPIIDGNVFQHNPCDGQWLSGVVSFVNGSSPQIINNIFQDNPCRAINMTLPQEALPQVINNTIVRNATGVRVDRRIPTAQQIYRNNLIVGNTIGLEVDFGVESYNPTWQSNLLFDNGVQYDVISDQTGKDGNLAADPLVVGRDRRTRAGQSSHVEGQGPHLVLVEGVPVRGHG